MMLGLSVAGRSKLEMPNPKKKEEKAGGEGEKGADHGRLVLSEGGAGDDGLNEIA